MSNVLSMSHDTHNVLNVTENMCKERVVYVDM
jgi:hypothetical protein